jgi:hypothetical protein
MYLLRKKLQHFQQTIITEFPRKEIVTRSAPETLSSRIISMQMASNNAKQNNKANLGD